MNPENKEPYNDNFSIVIWYKESRSNMNDVLTVVSSHVETVCLLSRKDK